MIGSYPGSATLLTIRSGVLYSLDVPGGGDGFTVTRWGPGGAEDERTIPFALSASMATFWSDADGLYAGTAVTRRLSDAPDVVLHIDPGSLQVLDTGPLGIGVPVEHDGRAWALTGDRYKGGVARVDLQTRKVLASKQLFANPEPQQTSMGMFGPVYGLGSVWVLVGNAYRMTLDRLDPDTLQILSAKPLDISGHPQEIHGLAADDGHVWIVGSLFAEVGADGGLLTPLTEIPALWQALPCDGGLLGLLDPGGDLVRLDDRGNILARSTFPGGGLGNLVVDGSEAWALGGDAATGPQIVHLSLPPLPGQPSPSPG